MFRVQLERKRMPGATIRTMRVSTGDVTVYSTESFLEFSTGQRTRIQRRSSVLFHGRRLAGTVENPLHTRCDV